MPDPEPLSSAREDIAEAEASRPVEGMAPNVVGALWMLGSAVAFTAMTTLIKVLGDEHHVMLQTFYRQTAGLVILAPWILRDIRGTFRTNRIGILLFRSGAGTLAMFMAFYAYQEMPLADANALSFTRTLWLVPLAAFVLREPLGPWRIGAALVGFAGVVLMLRPGGGEGEALLSLPALAMLGSSFLFALTITGMKVMTRDHSPFTLLAWAALLGFLFSLPPALFVWSWPNPRDFGLLCAMGAIGTATQFMYIKGMQVGDAAAMAPIDYTRLVFAGLAGFALFGELPTVVTLVGAGVVVASTLVITWREQRIARQARAVR